MTNARTRAGLGARRRSARGRRSPSTSSPSRPTPRRWPSSGSTPRTCSGSGTGSAAATRWTRRSGSRPCWRSGPSASARCSPASTRWTSTSASAPLERNLPVLMGLLAVWYGDFFGAQTVGVLPLRPVPAPLPRVPAAADHGVERQARRRSTAPASTTTPAPIYWGEPGTNGQHSFYQLIHQGTKLIPCDFIGFMRVAQSARRPPRPADLERVRPDRGARLRQDRRGGPRRGHPGADRPAPGDGGQPALEHDPGRAAHARARSAPWSRSTSTACSPRARSGGSTPSISGASSSARRWRSGSSPSCRPTTEPELDARQLHERADPPLPCPPRRLTRSSNAVMSVIGAEAEG